MLHVQILDPYILITRSLEILKETPKLVFHSSGLNLSNVSVSSDGFKTTQAPVAQTFEDKSERAILDFSSPFAKHSKVQLKIDFDANLTGDMMGYYYSTWEKEGKKQYYTLTQFEVKAKVFDFVAHRLTRRVFSPPQLDVLFRAGMNLCSKRRILLR